MRILVLGANGLIGHRVCVAARDRHETWGTIRGNRSSQPGVLDSAVIIEAVAAEDAPSIDRAFHLARPEVVINCIGLTKHRPLGSEPGAAFIANSFVPHYVRARCDAVGARLLHISTDCVFSGRKGDYIESDQPDAFDVYGLTKRLGEISAPGHLTIRTSIIGRSLGGSTDGLLEWFLAQQEPIVGFRRAIFSGLSTPLLAETIVAIIENHPNLTGLFHVAGERITKYDLLVLAAQVLSHNVRIEPRDEPVIDRSLNDDQFRAATGIPRPGWPEMLSEIRDDDTVVYAER